MAGTTVWTLGPRQALLERAERSRAECERWLRLLKDYGEAEGRDKERIRRALVREVAEIVRHDAGPV